MHPLIEYQTRRYLIMRIKYLGHACFLITSDDGTRIITDPYETTQDLTYGEIRESADVVTVSHEHGDHNNVAAVGGNPQAVRESASVKGIDFKGIPSYHDNSGGTKRGANTIFCFEVDGIRLCHLGDLGHMLTDKQTAELGKVEVLFVPVGGVFTIDAGTATEVCGQLNPRVIIPMHFKTPKSFPVIAAVEEFLQGKTNVSQPDTSEAEFGTLPETTQVMVLKPAL
jgi:L-ascorbate metabolism protein UlaG (beta-lactamase superfamily)